MAFSARLEMEGGSSMVDGIVVLNYHLDFKRQIDNYTGVTSRLNTFLIYLDVWSSGEGTDGIMFRWYASEWQTVTGRISIYETNDASGAVAKTVEFEDAHIFEFVEDFDTTGSRPLTIRLAISSRKIKYAGQEIDNSLVENQ